MSVSRSVQPTKLFVLNERDAKRRASERFLSEFWVFNVNKFVFFGAFYRLKPFVVNERDAKRRASDFLSDFFVFNVKK